MRETPRETDPAVVLASHDSGLSLSECAKKHGVPRGTIGRWLKERRDGKVVALRPAPIAIAPPAPPSPTPRAREAKTEAIARAVGPELRAALRGSVADLTSHIADESRRAREGRNVDMHQLASASRALVALLDKAGDLLAFDKNTTTQAPSEVPDVATEEGRAAVVARLRKLPRSLREGIG